MHYRGPKITNTIWVVPDYNYGIMGPQNPILIIKAPTVDPINKVPFKRARSGVEKGPLQELILSYWA